MECLLSVSFVYKVSLSLLDQAEGKEQTVRLELSITALDASVSMKGPCLEVSASVKDAIIRDCEVKSKTV